MVSFIVFDHDYYAIIIPYYDNNIILLHKATSLLTVKCNWRCLHIILAVVKNIDI